VISTISIKTDKSPKLKKADKIAMTKKLEMIDLKRRTNMINDRIRQINRSEIYQK
jgi:hypothetical protein